MMKAPKIRFVSETQRRRRPAEKGDLEMSKIVETNSKKKKKTGPRKKPLKLGSAVEVWEVDGEFNYDTIGLTTEKRIGELRP